MILRIKQLIGLPVRTHSGAALGKIAGFDMETDTGRMTTLYVKTRGLVAGLLDQELAVGWGQVISLDADAAVVRDAAVPAGSRTLAVASEAAPGVHLSARDADEDQGAIDA